MKVLLIKDVKSLGKVGEVKDVKDGYGTNFLIAKGLAKHANDAVLKQHASIERNRIKNEKNEIDDLTKLKEQLNGIKILIKKKLGNNGSLFGAITKDEVAHALNEQHKIEIDKKHIVMKKPIKATGNYDLDFKMGHAIHGTLHVEVAGE